jgi:manganese transport protein
MAEPASTVNPYAYDNSAVEVPPATLGGALRRVGPGLVLTASIVGSGELIATTKLGAEVGYVLLWAVIISCLIKVVIQAEIGRYTIATGETALQFMNHLPGRMFGLSWPIWLWTIVGVLVMFAVGGMYGGVAQTLNLMMPAIGVDVWVGVLLVITLAILLTGSYGHIEFVATLLVVIFTVLTVVTAALLLLHPEYFSWGSVGKGLAFDVPDKGFFTAVAVFGITGVGAIELTQYPYWCVEKGYARFAGVRDNSPAWTARARGWIRVMHVDILLAMLIYTFATIAFYLLGAGVLNTLGLIPESSKMIENLSKMYTEMLGNTGLYLFFFGAIAVLYSTIFAATAGMSRQFADLISLAGVYAPNDYPQRLKWQRIMVVAFNAGPVLLYYAVKLPALMVVITGVSIALLLPIVAICTLYLRYTRLPQAVVPPQWVSVLLWITTVVITVGMTWYALKQLPMFK